jgi:hypothetical protein
VYRLADGVEIVVQHGNHALQAMRLRELGETAQIADPQRRLDPPHVAALYRAPQDLPAGVATEIGRQQLARRAIDVVELDQHRQIGKGGPHDLDVGLREPLLHDCRDGQDVRLPAGKA